MSLILPELSRVPDRRLVIAPRTSTLTRKFEDLAQELTTDLSDRAELDLRAVRPPNQSPGPVQTWMSFNYGQRARMTVRGTWVGASLDHSTEISRSLLESNEGLILVIDPLDPQTDRLVRLPWTADSTSRPCLAWLQPGGSAPNLREKAMIAWLYRKFPQLQLVAAGDSILSKGLDWALSF